MFKKVVMTIFILFFFSVPAWAVKYHFNNEYYPTVSSATHIQDIWMDGYITAQSDWMYIYVQYGAHHAGSSMLGWKYMDGYTGTLKYSNVSECDSQCSGYGGWTPDTCYYTDYYENGTRMYSTYRSKCTIQSGGTGPGYKQFHHTDFWAP